MYKYKLGSIACLLALCVAFGGCSDKKKSVSVDTNKKEWQSETLDENVAADFKAENIESAYSYRIEKKALSVKKIKQIFFPEDKSKENYKKELWDEKNKELGYFEEVTTEKGLDVYANYEGISGRKPERDFYGNIISQDEKLENANNLWKYLGTEEDLPFMSKKDMEAKVRAQIKKMGLPYEVSNIYIRTMSSEYLNGLTEKYLREHPDAGEDDVVDRNQLKTWKKNEGAYYVLVELSLDGVPINAKGCTQEPIDGITIDTAGIELMYNKNGCMYLECPYFEVLEKQEKSDILSVSEAVELIKKELTDVILSEDMKYMVNSGELCYAYVNGEEKTVNTKASLKPVWMFNIRISDSNGSLDRQYFVDAVTGKVMK